MEYSPPPFFKTGPTPLVRLLIFSVLALALMAADAHFRYLDRLREAVAVAVYPLQRLAGAPSGLAHRIGQFFVTHAYLREENERLTRENFLNAAALQQLKALEAENKELRALMGARMRLTTDSTLAEILYTARDPFSRKIVIDKGSQNGIAAGQAVIDDRGVIGQVTRVYPWTAEVTLITDKGLAVPVTNLRSGLRGMVFGVGREGALELRFMPINADVTSGDRLVTSGIDGTYPPGVPVAEVTDIERDTAYTFADITAKPIAGVGAHAHVLVLSWEERVPPAPAPKKPTTANRAKPKKGA